MNRKRLWLCIIWVTTILVSLNQAQELGLSGGEIVELTQEFQNSVQKSRMTAFYALLQLGHTDEVRPSTGWVR